jgi:molecular chaperone DnaK (HSP70)
MSFGNLTNGFGSLSLISRHKIIVGVDYGTTFTGEFLAVNVQRKMAKKREGASYVSTEGRDISDIIIIKTWPGPARDTETVFKTPSRIAYPADNRRIGTQRWGFQVEPGMTAYTWTKLLLDQDTPLTKYDDAALEDASGMGILRLPEGKGAVEVVSDFLSEVYKHILKTIAKQITEETLRITPLEFWFTVPAIWSDRAQDATRKAARLAGFGNTPGRSDDKIFMITEPEAAAIAALKKTTTDGLGASVKVSIR